MIKRIHTIDRVRDNFLTFQRDFRPQPASFRHSSALLGRGLTQLSPTRISEFERKRGGRFFDVSLASSRFNLSPLLLFHFRSIQFSIAKFPKKRFLFFFFAVDSKNEYKNYRIEILKVISIDFRVSRNE